MDAAGHPLQSQTASIERKLLGRPVLIDLWDTRPRPNSPQAFSITVPAAGEGVAVEAVVRYWLMNLSHRDHIDYREPISDEIYRPSIPLVAPVAHSGQSVPALDQSHQQR